jgi:hypothetical protein
MIRKMTCRSLLMGIVLFVLAATSGACARSKPGTPTPPGKAAVSPTGTASMVRATPTLDYTLLAFVVGNTGGEGVFIRRSPSLEDRILAWPNGTVMIPVGHERQVDGKLWENVVDPAGNEGWIPSDYLIAVPRANVPTPSPSATAAPKSTSPPTAAGAATRTATPQPSATIAQACGEIQIVAAALQSGPFTPRPEELRCMANPKGPGTFVYLPQARSSLVKRHIAWLVLEGKGYSVNAETHLLTPKLANPTKAIWDKAKLHEKDALEVVFGS